MTYMLSMVTMNRRQTLFRVLDAIYDTTETEQKAEGVRVLVTDNGSTDGTVGMLRSSARWPGIEVFPLPENAGTERARNITHWPLCVGHDTVRIDDKVLPLAPDWLTVLRLQSQRHHSIVATPYDPTVTPLQVLAPTLGYVNWPENRGRGGPLIFIPGEVTAALGGCDELHPDHRYGYSDCLYIERAMLLGWKFGFSLRCPVEYLARADPSRRNSAAQWHTIYMERSRQYAEGERDLYIPIGNEIPKSDSTEPGKSGMA